MLIARVVQNRVHATDSRSYYKFSKLLSNKFFFKHLPMFDNFRTPPPLLKVIFVAENIFKTTILVFRSMRQHLEHFLCYQLLGSILRLI